MDIKHFVFIFLILAGLSFATIPTSVTVHGKLTNANNVSQASKTINMTFAIYNVTSGGTALYTKSNVNVATDYAGVYSYELTGITLPFDANYYLGVTVANDSEMTPRINITSNGYAYRANVSDTLMSSGNYVVATMNATTFYGNLAWSYLTSVPAIVVNGSSANLTSVYADNFYGDLNASYVQNAPWAIPGTATCSGVEVAQNVTTTTSGTTSQCITPPQGTVTSVIAGSGLTGGTITVSGTLAVNDSYIIALLDNATIARNGTATCTGTDAAQKDRKSVV